MSVHIVDFSFYVDYFTHHHPETFWLFDFSMIKLQKPFEINKYYSTAKPAWWNVNPVCMPPPMNEENAAYYRPNAFFYKFGPLKVTGWGRLEENKPNKHLYFAGKTKICFIIDMPITTKHNPSQRLYFQINPPLKVKDEQNKP